MDCSLVCNLFFSLNTFRNLNLNSANLNFYHFIGLISFYAFYYYFDLHKVHLSSTKSTFMKSGVYIFLKFKKNILGIMKLFSYFQQNFIDVCVLCICMNLYSVAVLTTTRDQTMHLALVQRPIPQIINPSHTTKQTTNPLIA